MSWRTHYQGSEELMSSLDYAALAESQRWWGVRELLASRVRSQTRKIDDLEWEYCNVTTETPRSFLTKPFRRTAFDLVHNLAHSDVSTTGRLAAQHYVWSSMRKDCRSWARAYVLCQRSKVSRHVSAPWKSHCTIKAILTYPYRHNCNASLWGQALLLNMRRLFYARGIRDERSGGWDDIKDIVRRLDLPFWSASQDHHGPVRVSFFPAPEWTFEDAALEDNGILPTGEWSKWHGRMISSQIENSD